MLLAFYVVVKGIIWFIILALLLIAFFQFAIPTNPGVGFRRSAPWLVVAGALIFFIVKH